MNVYETYAGGVVITPSDTAKITFPGGTTASKGLYVGTAGDVSAVMADGAAVTFTGLPAGIHRLSVLRINFTGTTATNLVALY